MRDWQRFWNESAQVRSEDPLRQVGKTVNGQPISAKQLASILADMERSLELSPGDRLLDLCCGNGLLTRSLAALCQRACGVDFSAPLVEAARQHPNPPNLCFIISDITDMPEEILCGGWNKVCLYEALQHFDPPGAERIFSQLDDGGVPVQALYIGSVPDRDRLWNFYDTPARRREFERRSLEGREAIGRWWGIDELTALAERHGFTAEVRHESASPHTAHYRFDVLCRRRDGAGK